MVNFQSERRFSPSSFSPEVITHLVTMTPEKSTGRASRETFAAFVDLFDVNGLGESRDHPLMSDQVSNLVDP